MKPNTARRYPYRYVRVLPRRGWPRRWGFWGRITETGLYLTGIGESLGHYPAFSLRERLNRAGTKSVSAPNVTPGWLPAIRYWYRLRYVTGSIPLRFFQTGFPKCRNPKAFKTATAPKTQSGPARSAAPRASAALHSELGFGHSTEQDQEGGLCNTPLFTDMA